MKNFRYQSLIGISLTSLYLVNVALILAAFFVEGSLVPAAALILSFIQLALHKLFERKAALWLNNPVSYLYSSAVECR